MEQEQRWMTIKEAAGYIGVSISFLRKHLSRLPHARAGGKILRFRRNDLDNWLEQNGRGENFPTASRKAAECVNTRRP
jgi:excisionase family DNA binding protein